MRNLLIIAALALTFYSCNNSSDTPVTPQPSNTIYTQAGIIDSFRVNTIGTRSQTANFFSSPYDFTGLDSITVQFTYWKSGSSTTPVSFVYIESAVPNTIYGHVDSLTTMHSNTLTKRVPSPKKSVTLGYTINAIKTALDVDYAYVKLTDVSILRK